MTTFENKCAILADLWLNYRYHEQFEDFIAYNDLGLPLAYAIDSGIVENTDLSTPFIDETFQALLVGLDVDDVGYEDFDGVWSNSQK